LQKIDRNFACFWPLKFFRGGPPSCPTLASDCHQIAIMWQSFATIGRGTAEIWLPKEKKTSAVKHKPVRNDGFGRPNKKDIEHAISACRGSPAGRFFF